MTGSCPTEWRGTRYCTFMADGRRCRVISSFVNGGCDYLVVFALSIHLNLFHLTPSTSARACTRIYIIVRPLLFRAGVQQQAIDMEAGKSRRRSALLIGAVAIAYSLLSRLAMPNIPENFGGFANESFAKVQKVFK